MYNFLYTTTGKVISHGENKLPTCLLKLLTYRIEEVDLPGPTTFALDEGAVTVSKYWRIVVTFSSSGGDGVLSIECTSILSKTTADNRKEVSALVFDRSLLREGAKISFAYGYNKKGETLPETLQLQTSP